MFAWLIFAICLLITVLIHELGHLFSALLCKVKVETFSIGFGKPIFQIKWKNIKWNITPILLGGYIKLAGEYNKIKGGFLSKRYLVKFFVSIAGVSMNWLLAFLCYWINYRSITQGLIIDWQLMCSIFTKDFATTITILEGFQGNIFLLQLGLLNFGCGLFNLLPIPALDGGSLWLVWLEKIYPKTFRQVIKKWSSIGFKLLMILQLLLLLWVFFI